jgi:hypothetical protein
VFVSLIGPVTIERHTIRRHLEHLAPQELLYILHPSILTCFEHVASMDDKISRFISLVRGKEAQKDLPIDQNLTGTIDKLKHPSLEERMDTD